MTRRGERGGSGRREKGGGRREEGGGRREEGGGRGEGGRGREAVVLMYLFIYL